MTRPLFCTSRPRGVIYAFERSTLIKPWIRLCGGASGRGGTCSVPFAAAWPALTEEVTAKDNVAVMSAAKIKRVYRAPNVALMRCDFVRYMPEAVSFRHARAA